MFLWRYAERLADGDDGWWCAATRRTADMLEDGFWWIDDTGPVPMTGLLIDTTAVLVHGLARSHGADPAAVTGTDLVTWATPRIAGMLQLAEDLYLRPPTDPDGMWAWHRAFSREWRTTVQQVAYLLVAAGHDLLPTADAVHPPADRSFSTGELLGGRLSSTGQPVGGRLPSTGRPSAGRFSSTGRMPGGWFSSAGEPPGGWSSSAHRPDASRRSPDVGRHPRADPVAGLWRELIEGDGPGRRYPAVAGPAIVHGLTEMVRHFGSPAHR